MNLLSTIIAGIAIFFSSIFGLSNQSDISSLRLDVNHLQETVSQNVGATNAIPTPVALFETTLAGNISSSATSMTLTSAADKTGTTLASSTYAFIIEEGSASEEMVLADCTGTACTNMTRGINVITGTSTSATLQFAHRRGASVKITDGPQIMILTRIINGVGTFPNKLLYTSGVSITAGDSGQTIISKSYADALVNQGAATSTESNGGIVELGTLAEQADSYSGGADKPTVLQTKNSTSTCQVVGSYNIIASSTTGKLDKNCFDQTANYTLTGNNTFSGTTTMATSTVASSTITNLNVTGTFYSSVPTAVATSTTFSTAGSFTWVKPSGVTKVDVELIGGGGAGGGTTVNGGVFNVGDGGGSGAYCRSIITVSGNVTVTVGAGGTGVSGATGNSGGSSSFAGDVTITAGAGGGGAATQPSALITSGGSAGGCTNADLSIPGDSGNHYNSTGTYVTNTSGSGADSFWGWGGRAVGVNNNGNAGTGYGSGGSGAASTNDGSHTGGAGKLGLVIIHWYQ